MPQAKGRITRIRCTENTFRRFKRKAADLGTYEETLIALLTTHDHFGQIYTADQGKYATLKDLRKLEY